MKAYPSSILQAKAHKLYWTTACTFKENCFVRSYYSDGIAVSNSIFQSYTHKFKSIIAVLSSVVTLTGNVNFTDSNIKVSSSLGTTVFLQTTHLAEVKSSLNITMGATVYFINLTCDSGGAVYGGDTMMHIGAKARVVFMNNTASLSGGAALILGGNITVGAESCVIFKYNHAVKDGGALLLQNSTIHVNTSGIEFYDNKASVGGAIFFTYGSMDINTNKSLKFITSERWCNLYRSRCPPLYHCS